MKTIEVDYRWYACATTRLKVKVPDDCDLDNIDVEVEDAVEKAASVYDASHSMDWQVDGSDWEVIKRE